MSDTRSTSGLDPQRFLSEAECQDIAKRLARYAKGGNTGVVITSTWSGRVRWARNLISMAEEVRNNELTVYRDMDGAAGATDVNEITDPWLQAAVQRANRVAHLQGTEEWDAGLKYRRTPEQSASVPQLFSDATYHLDAGARADLVRHLVQSAASAGMLSAGYLEVAAHSQALIGSWGFARYFQFTTAQYSVTVRDPTGIGSGWAGVDVNDWQKIDGEHLSAVALEKCLKSRHPVAVEPGRYTTILEAQAVGDFVGRLFFGGWSGLNPLDRVASHRPGAPFNASKGVSRLGDLVVDKRITMTADPADPECGFPPFSLTKSGAPESFQDTDVYHPVTWIEDGVLKNLAYDRAWAVYNLQQDTGLPNAGAFRMSGGPTTVEEMIATTKRGLLVTRFDLVEDRITPSLLVRGYTRDGFWLIENGKISKPIKNMAFTESILFALNNVEQLGVPQRIFHPRLHLGWQRAGEPQPVVVPPMKVKDFSFTALSDAI